MLNADGKSPFMQKAYMIVNLALGGANGGDPAEHDVPADVPGRLHPRVPVAQGAGRRQVAMTLARPAPWLRRCQGARGPVGRRRLPAVRRTSVSKVRSWPPTQPLMLVREKTVTAALGATRMPAKPTSVPTRTWVAFE